MEKSGYWKYLETVVSQYNKSEQKRLKGTYWCHLEDSVIAFNNQKKT